MRDDKLYREYSYTRSSGPPLTIHAGGTYTWADRDGKVVRGRWRAMTNQEDVFFGGRAGIVLQNAVSGYDWQILYNGALDLRDMITIKSRAGNFDGRRAGASKGKPAYTRPEYVIGQTVVVNDGTSECNGTVVGIAYEQTATYYEVDYTCRGNRNVGKIVPARMRPR